MFNIIAIGDNLERGKTLLHYFYCESFVHLLVFDALLSLTWNSCKYQILFESFLILVVLRVSFPPCTNKKIKTEIGYKYERVLESKQTQNKPLSQGEIFLMKSWTAPPCSCAHLTPSLELQLLVTAQLLAPQKGGAAKAHPGNPWGRDDLGGNLNSEAEAAASSLACLTELTPQDESFISLLLTGFSWR